MNSAALVSRRKLAGVTALAAVTVAMPALFAQPKPERKKLSIAVVGKSTFYYLPLTISEQLGYFRAEGLDVEIMDLASGASDLHAPALGAADICSGAFEQIINLQAKNQSFRAFVMQGRAPQIAFGISNKNMMGFKSVADLRGKKIGVSARGSSTNLLADRVLSRSGVPASDVSYVGVGTSAGALVALRSGQIDALCNVDPLMTILEQKGEVQIISDTRTLKGTAQLFGGPMPAGCMYASEAFIQKNPNTCQALANAIVHGLKWLQTAGPGDILKAVPESYLLGDRALYLASFNKVRESISLDGLIPDDGPRTAVKALAAFDPGIKAEKIDISRLYTNEFARRAKDRFKA